MPDLSTTYLGLELRSPLVASSSPMTGDLDHLVALQAAGAGAVVLPSLFEEQIVRDSVAVNDYLEAGVGVFAEAAAGYVPELDSYNTGPTRYLRLVSAARQRLDIPVIASLNGDTHGGWLSYATQLAEASASALELNIYRVAADPADAPRAVEDEVVDIIRSVRTAVEIPIAVKLSPYYSAFGNLAVRAVEAGADGLVLFNRFFQPDIDIDTLQPIPELSLSTRDEIRLPLRWAAILHDRIDASLAITSGVQSWREVAKALLVGANVAMMASQLLREGPGALTAALDGLDVWMVEHEYASVRQMTGAMSQRKSGSPDAFERANYVETLTTYASTFRP